MIILLLIKNECVDNYVACLPGSETTLALLSINSSIMLQFETGKLLSNKATYATYVRMCYPVSLL